MQWYCLFWTHAIAEMQSCSDNMTDRIIAGSAITAVKADTTYRNTDKQMDKQMDSSPVHMKNLNKYMAYDSRIRSLKKKGN